MEKQLYIKSTFDAWFLANGRFMLSGDKIITTESRQVYVTVFPVCTALLPYTALIVGDRLIGEDAPVSIVSLEQGQTLALFDRRYECVFTPEDCIKPPQSDEGILQDCFSLVKSGELDKARAYLTKALSESVDDAALTAFFADYQAVISAQFITGDKSSYLFIRQDGTASRYAASFVADKLDDVKQLE